MTEPGPWYDAAFGRGYVELYPQRDLAAARVEVAGLLERGVAGRVLDLGCGFGRHLLALRERAIDAFGLDRSLELLGLARDCAGGMLRGRLVRGDFRALPLGARTFDCVLMLFSSFGYFDDDGNELVLREVARCLRPGGLAVLDLMNPALVRATLVPHSCNRHGALEIDETRRLEHGGTRVVKDVVVRADGGSEQRWREDVRLYQPEELDRLLARAGLRLARREGDFDGRSFDSRAPRQIVWVHGPG